MMMLPEDCVAKILSFTTPADTMSSAAVSSVFRCAGDSDFVWENFLPSDYDRMISQSIGHLSFSTKKDLYRRLCESILIDDGRKMFKIDKFSGKISYVLSARDLSITWSDQPMYWSWNRRQDSRFAEAVELVMTDWLEIHGKIRTGLLSPSTRYGAYLVMKVTARAYGLDLVPAKTSIRLGNDQTHKNSTYLCCLEDKKELMKRLIFANREERMAEVVVAEAGGGQLNEPKERSDGWMEIELGEFETGKGDHDNEVVMGLTEVEGFQLKGGIVVEGIEVRPKP
ncbi:PREDICTED: F-box protein PP2-B15-like [Tarenaya hassleriana]|uniref:F-box protein PP2-B15-like n=1 Tax=Tarenaya hassleriana TaxID=28532 RepID=UPI00053C3E75|nr:PREDICTED: F-box protein PP2-B15-like [Tarenaya hassleriana]